MRTLKRLLGGLLLVGAFVTPALAESVEGLPPLILGASVNAMALMSPPPAADGLVLNGVTSTATSILVSGIVAYGIDAQIWSAAGSTATVLIECRSYYTAPWYPCFTITNPDTGDTTSSHYYSLPLAFQYRLRVSAWTAGTIFGTLILYK